MDHAGTYGLEFGESKNAQTLVWPGDAVDTSAVHPSQMLNNLF